MLRSSAMRLQSDLPQSDMENLLRQRFLLRQRHRAGQGTTVSAPSPSVIKKGMTAGEACHALLIKLLRSGRLP